MNKQLAAHPSFSSTLRLASAGALLVALAGPAAHAQGTVLLTAPPAGQFATPTATYPTGDSGGFISGPFTRAAGSVSVTFTATNPGVYSFESFTNFDNSLDFPTNTVAIDTFDDNKHNPTGPLLVSFSAGISAFGLNVESSRADTSIFSFTAYDGANVIGQYTLPPVTQVPGSPNSIFLGAQAIGGNQITSVLISDASNASGYTAGSNDFYFGPLSTFSPVPEASTTVSFGLLLALGVGAMAMTARKRAARNASRI